MSLVEINTPKSGTEVVENWRRIRCGLRNPTNAVPDDGIDLKRRIQTPPKPKKILTESGLVDRLPKWRFRPWSEYIITDDEYTETYIRGFFTSTKPAHVGIDDIQRTVARFYRITRAGLISHRRIAKLVWPRHVAVFLCKELTDHSLPKIAQRFDNRDHTTAINSMKKVRRRLAVDEKFAAEVEYLKAELQGLPE